MELYPCTAKAEGFTAELECTMALRHDFSLYALSIVGHERSISFVSAGLSKGESGFNFTLDSSCKSIKYPGQDVSVGTNILPAPGGFNCIRHHLGYDSWHMVAISRSPKFLFQADDQALWNLLRSTEFTTPMLRAWIPQVRKAMTSVGLIKKCAGFGAEGVFVQADSNGLDKVVGEGIRAGVLPILSDGAMTPVALSA